MDSDNFGNKLSFMMVKRKTGVYLFAFRNRFEQLVIGSYTNLVSLVTLTLVILI